MHNTFCLFLKPVTNSLQYFLEKEVLIQDLAFNFFIDTAEFVMHRNSPEGFS